MIQRSSIPELESAATFVDLIAEYAEESAIQGLPPPAARFETYRHLEAAKLLYVFSAIHDGNLIGFITVLKPVLTHYALPPAMSESFFVAKAHRHTMAGIRLLVAAENLTAEIKMAGLIASAPFGSKLAELLPKCGYVPVTISFFKQVPHAG